MSQLSLIINKAYQQITEGSKKIELEVTDVLSNHTYKVTAYKMPNIIRIDIKELK